MAVAKAKTWASEEFGKAVENNFCEPSKRFWITVWHIRRWKEYTVNTSKNSTIPLMCLPMSKLGLGTLGSVLFFRAVMVDTTLQHCVDI